MKITPTYQDVSTPLLAILDAASGTSTLTSDVLLTAFGTAAELRLYGATVPGSADSAEPSELVATLPVTLSAISGDEGLCLLDATEVTGAILLTCEKSNITARLVQSGDTGAASDSAMRLQYRYCPDLGDDSITTLTVGGTISVVGSVSGDGSCFRVVRL